MKWYYISLMTSPDELVEIGDWCMKNIDGYWAVKSHDERINKAKPHRCSSLTWKKFRKKIYGDYPQKGKVRMLAQTEYDAVTIKLRWS